LLACSCSESDAVDAGKGGAARVALEGATYDVRNVAMTIETSEDSWFRIEGVPAVGGRSGALPALPWEARLHDPTHGMIRMPPGYEDHGRELCMRKLGARSKEELARGACPPPATWRDTR